MKWKRLGRGAAHPAGIARYTTTPSGKVIVWCDGTRNRREWRWNFMTLRYRPARGSEVRVSRVDWEQASAVLAALAAEGITRRSRVVCAGLSRGGAIAWIVAYRLGGESRSFAGKRAGNRAFSRAAPHVLTARRGDVVPWLPPWYARPSAAHWLRPRMWPWAAHMWAARRAARWRHELSKV